MAISSVFTNMYTGQWSGCLLQPLLCGTLFSGVSLVTRRIIFVFLFLAPICGWAQLGKKAVGMAQDTTKKEPEKSKRKFAIRTVYLLEDSALFKPNHFTAIDTTLTEVDETDVGMTEGRYYRRINNIGSASLNLEFDPLRTPGFNLGLTAHSIHLLKSNNLRYYDSYTPYTQLRYVQGDGELQLLDIFHTQSLTERINIGITYRSIKSVGFYQNEANLVKNIGFHGRHKSASGNYQLLVYGLWNTLDLNESGGIEGVDQFDSDAFQIERVRITQPSLISEGADYWWRNSEIGLRQLKYFGDMDSVTINDSQKVGRLVPRVYASHKLKYTSNTSKFNSDTSDVFNLNYSFMDRHFEVLQHQEISNEFSMGIFLNKKEILKRDSSAITEPYAEQVLRFGVDFRVGRAGAWGLDRLVYAEPSNLTRWQGYSNFHIFGNLSKQLTPVTHFKGSINYVLVGSQFSDYDLDLRLKQVVWKKLNLKPFLKTQAVSPYFITDSYVSGFARWGNDFRKEFHNEIGASLNYAKNTSITLSVRRSDNLVYFDEMAEVQQTDLGVNYLQIKLRKNFDLRKFHLQHEVAWQQMNETSPYRVPEFIAKVNYYFQSDIFKKAANFRFGISGWYYSSYRASAYQPGIAQFHLQNERSVGGYPVFHVYLSANVKKWNGFFRYEHANDAITGYDYEMLLNYPMNPAALRMGVAWRFYD